MRLLIEIVVAVLSAAYGLWLVSELRFWPGAKEGRVVAFALDDEEGEPEFFPVTQSDIAGRIAMGFLYLAFAVWVGRHALGLVL